MSDLATLLALGASDLAEAEADLERARRDVRMVRRVHETHPQDHPWSRVEDAERRVDACRRHVLAAGGRP